MKRLAFVALCAIVVSNRHFAAGQEVQATEPNRGGTISIEARDPEVAKQRLFPAKGYSVDLFASEKDFPIGNPVALNFDTRGRMWVMTMPSYPQRLPDEQPNDKIVILEDTDADGKADKHVVFADKLHVPTGFELGDGGAYIAQQPNLIFARDTDGDDVADERHIILHGFGTEDSHHSISAFVWGPGGGLYFQEGTFHHSQVETPWGPVRLVDAGIFRYDPIIYRLDVFVSYPFANPWGHIFDRWGQNFIADASGGSNYFGSAITGNAPYPRKRSGMKVFTTVVRPTAGCEIVSSRHFPPEAQGNFLVNNTIGFQGIKQHRMIEEGSGFTSEEVEPLLYSTDINFRPVDIEFGPDGALYIVDWFNPLIGHMQYSLRDPNRDHTHGRIWRITYNGLPLLEPPKIDGQPIEKLLDLLKVYEDRTRYRVRIELRNRDRGEVLSALDRWVAGLDPSDSEHEHHLLEALWVHQVLNDVDLKLLDRVLQSPEPRARAAATRVVRFWRDQLEDPAAILEKMVHDEFPRVRLEAILALSYLPSVEATKIALGALEHPMDYYLDYVLNETITTLQPQWEPALADGTLMTSIKDSAEEYLLSKVSTGSLARFANSEAVNMALLTRPGVEPEQRRRALANLAEQRKQTPAGELVRVISDLDGRGGSAAQRTLPDLGAMLGTMDSMALSPHRETLAKLASEGDTGIAQRIGFAGLAIATGDSGEAWKLASENLSGLPEFARAAGLVADTKIREGFYPQIKTLLAGLPAETMRRAGSSRVRYIRIETPGDNREFELAEVEVFEKGVNVARSAKASQSSTYDNAAASRAIDGNTDGRFDAGSVSHTGRERDPWFEIDLGRECAVEFVRIWPRTDSGVRARLEGFAMAWLDTNRVAVFAQSGLPAPAPGQTYDPGTMVREAAIESIVAFDSRTGETFTALAELVSRGASVDAALAAMASLPEDRWPEADFMGLAAHVVAHLESIPVERLSSPSVQSAFHFGARLAARLPDSGALELRNALSNLNVTVIDIAPIPHKMVFDVSEFTVRAGRPVEIAFENLDIMPHNVVISKPGTLAAVGQLAEDTSTEPGAPARNYVPQTSDVLWATALVNPGGKDRLSFVAPAAPGNYPFICTYPGHWITMNGVMRVVEELDSTMVAVRRTDAGEISEGHARHFVKDWTLEDLMPEMSKLDSDRSFENGRAMFEAAGCVQCHEFGGAGKNVGPKLSEALTKYKGGDLLREILQPSREVLEGYESYIVETADFSIYTGMLAEQSETAIKLRANPANPDEITEIPRKNIEKIEKANLSAMPTGLLTTLSKEEILDLLAYIQAGADPKHAAFTKR